MKIIWRLAVFAVVAAVLSGCSSTPEVPEEEKPLTLSDRFLQQAEEITAAGGFAAAGIAESQSLDLALNYAKTNGRRNLAALLETRAGTLRDTFTAENGPQTDDPFSGAAQDIIGRNIRDLVAGELKYETTNDLVTACSLMEISPRILLDRLTDDEELSSRMEGSQALKELKNDINRYETYKAGLTPAGK